MTCLDHTTMHCRGYLKGSWSDKLDKVGVRPRTGTGHLIEHGRCRSVETVWVKCCVVINRPAEISTGWQGLDHLLLPAALLRMSATIRWTFQQDFLAESQIGTSNRRDTHVTKGFLRYESVDTYYYGSASFISLLNLSIHLCFVCFQSTCGLG